MDPKELINTHDYWLIVITITFTYFKCRNKSKTDLNRAHTHNPTIFQQIQYNSQLQSVIHLDAPANAMITMLTYYNYEWIAERVGCEVTTFHCNFASKYCALRMHSNCNILIPASATNVLTKRFCITDWGASLSTFTIWHLRASLAFHSVAHSILPNLNIQIYMTYWSAKFTYLLASTTGRQWHFYFYF